MFSFAILPILLTVQNKGFVTCEDLKRVWEQLGEKDDDFSPVQLFEAADINGDGTIGTFSDNTSACSLVYAHLHFMFFDSCAYRFSRVCCTNDSGIAGERSLRFPVKCRNLRNSCQMYSSIYFVMLFQ
jgi:hypothetical protein